MSSRLKPSHRLAALLVPEDPTLEPSPDQVQACLDGLRSRGLLSGDGPGPNVDSWSPGGFRRLRVDRPGRLALYANRQGGFHVRCPDCQSSVVAEMSRAWSKRQPSLVCRSCAQETGLPDLTYLPPAAYARFALELSQVQTLVVLPAPEITALLGPYRIIGVRG